MARTSAAPEASDPTLTGATILPGVPLPSWGVPAEPVLPDPPPAPAPMPVPVAVASAPDPAPPAPIVETVVLAAPPVASTAPETAPEPSAIAVLDEPVPQLAPPTPVPPRAEVYAAAGAAPPTAPWGTPPATSPIDLEPPVTEPAEEAPAEADSPGSAPQAGHRAAPSGRSGSSGRALRVVGVVGSVLVLGAVAAFVWPGFLLTEDEPAAPAPRPAASVAARVQLQAPDSAAGLTRLSGAPSEALAKAATGTDLAGYTAPVSAVYGTGTTPVATVLAWNATTRGSSVDVSTAFAGYQGATGRPLSGIVSVAVGRLGGQMSCGSTMVATTPASVCFWADDATFGAVTVLRPADATAGAATAIALRRAVETRS